MSYVSWGKEDPSFHVGGDANSPRGKGAGALLPPSEIRPLPNYHPVSKMEQFINRVLALLDGEMCRNCGQRMSCHASWGEWCQEGTWFSKTKKFERAQ